MNQLLKYENVPLVSLLVTRDNAKDIGKYINSIIKNENIKIDNENKDITKYNKTIKSKKGYKKSDFKKKIPKIEKIRLGNILNTRGDISRFITKYQDKYAQIFAKLRHKREVNNFDISKNYIVKGELSGANGVIYQKPIFDIDSEKLVLADEEYFNAIISNPENILVDEFIINGDLNSYLYSILLKDDNFLNFSVQGFYIYKSVIEKIDQKTKIKTKKTVMGTSYGPNKTFGRVLRKDNNFNMAPLNTSETSNTIYIAIGYRVLFITKPNTKAKNTTIRDLKAFNPSNNRKYHELSVASTGNYKICIYETFLDVIGVRSLKYVRQNKKNHAEIMNRLKNEGSEIEKLVKTGRLIDSLELLTKKYNKEVYIIYYQDKYTTEKDVPLHINNKGILSEIKYEDIPNGTRLIIHEKNVHVSPGFKSIVSEKKMNEKIKKAQRQFFKLSPQIIKKIPKGINNIIGFDFETFNDNDKHAKSFCITMYGQLGNEKISKVFYGNNSDDDFIKYLLEIRTKKNDKKSRPKGEIPNIYIYGFNNSNFDNLLFYKKLYDQIPYMQIQFANKSIKYIKFDNIYIYDISLFYKAGTLRDTCKQFNLEEEKGVYPYSFPNKDNLNYEGEIPNIKYWKSEDEYYECQFEHVLNTKFNLKEYTIKYCLLDSKLVFELAKIHAKNCVGEILGKNYNLIKCPTAANMALKMFEQIFLENDLIQSPENIIVKEKNAYKGGRTEVFKKEFKQKNKNDKLYYFDINSSYPASMMNIMPYKYISTTKYEDYEISHDEIVDHHLYYCKSEYMGNDKYHIPNLMCRLEDGSLDIRKNTDYSHHWGVEIKEAILNKYKIIVKEINSYEGKIIFDKYSNYFYNERLKIKKTNSALALFFKALLNSLYGKFGQKQFDNSALLKYEDLCKLLTDDMVKLVDWEVIDDSILVSYKETGDNQTSIGTLVRFSSYISAVSRTRLCEVMRDIGHEHIYYCDTDSVFTDKKPSDKYLDNNKLGAWKLEDEIKSAVFLGKKFYKYEKISKNVKVNKYIYGKDGYIIKVNKDFTESNIKKACKGVPAKDIKDNDYNNMLEGTLEKVGVEKTMFFRSYNGVKIENKQREVKPIYNKRIWEGNNSMAF